MKDEDAIAITTFPEEPKLYYTLRTTSVFVRTSFIGYHRWKDAPASVAYLREYHRHNFQIRAGVSVAGEMNRGIEFNTLKKEIDHFLLWTFTEKQFEHSCEQIGEAVIAFLIHKKYRPTYIEVSEDGENGSFSFVRYFKDNGKIDAFDGNDIDIMAKEIPNE